MSSFSKSAKQLQIDKANAFIVIMVSIAAIVTAFSLVSVKALLSQKNYQSRVIKQQVESLTVAHNDLDAIKSLNSSYVAFNNQPINTIGGLSNGTGPQDGPNSKIILDALPSQYDFPALMTSIQKILTDRGFKIQTLSGVDDASLANAASSTSPVPVEIPFQFSVSGSYDSVKDLVAVLERSIRPISIDTLQITSSDSSTVTLTVSAKTYFQPAKNLNVKMKVIK